MGRNSALDGVRAVAVIAVLASHTVGAFEGGFLGVDVFFVLSGYLITSLLLAEQWRTGGVDLLEFYRRRIARLAPAYLAMLLLAVPMMLGPLAWRMHWPVPAAVAVSAGYGANWAAAHDVDALGPIVHTWSLAIEEQFYLVWPVCFLALARGGRSLRRWLAAGIVVVVAARAAGWLVSGGIWPYFATITHADGLLAGCLLAVLLFRRSVSPRQRRWSGRVVGPALVVLALLAATLRIHSAATHLFGLTVAVVAITVLVGHLVMVRDGRLAGVLGIAPLVGIGRISYGLYLYHLPIFELTQSLGLPGSVNVALEWGSTAAVAVGSWFWLEQPVRRWARARWSRTPAASPGERPRVPTPAAGVRIPTPARGIGTVTTQG